MFSCSQESIHKELDMKKEEARSFSENMSADECCFCETCFCCTHSSTDSLSAVGRTRRKTSCFSRVCSALCCVFSQSSCSRPPSSSKRCSSVCCMAQSSPSHETSVTRGGEVHAMECLSLQSESGSPGESDSLVEAAAEHESVKNSIKTQNSDPGLSGTGHETDNLRTRLKRSSSLPDFEEFTPDITVEDKDKYDVCYNDDADDEDDEYFEDDEDDCHIFEEVLFDIPMMPTGSLWSLRKACGRTRRSHGSHCETGRIKLIKTPADIRARKKASSFSRGARVNAGALPHVYASDSMVRLTAFTPLINNPPSVPSEIDHFLLPSLSSSEETYFPHEAQLHGGSLAADADCLSVQCESESTGDSNALVEMEEFVTAEHKSFTNTMPTQPLLQSSDPGLSRKVYSLTRSISLPDICQLHSHKHHASSPQMFASSSQWSLTESNNMCRKKDLTRSISLPDILYKEFTPVITADEDDETYRFQCSSPGLYLCSVTGLMFGMKGEGDVVYRIVPWNRRLLVQHHKKPAGPLFDITCVQQCVSQLHLPHCEISSTGGAQFLSVAHVTDDGDVEFIGPQKVTETHVVISITGFSAYGNVKDENSPPDPVRALVLLFYRPPADPDPDPESQINVLLLPKNVCLHDVQRTRKKLVGDETYIETSPHCKLKPNQVYTLSTCPQDDSVLVQPTEAEFDEDSYNNYFPSFQVDLEEVKKHIKLILRDTNSSDSVWERRVCLSSSGTRKSCEQRALNLPPNKRLLHVRSSFIDGISEPVLTSLLDKLLEKKVITDSERESVNAPQNKRDKARVVIDTVRNKGEAASSEMIDFLCELDPFLCEHLDLT